MFLCFQLEDPETAFAETDVTVLSKDITEKQKQVVT